MWSTPVPTQVLRLLLLLALTGAFSTSPPRPNAFGSTAPCTKQGWPPAGSVAADRGAAPPRGCTRCWQQQATTNLTLSWLNPLQSSSGLRPSLLATRRMAGELELELEQACRVGVGVRVRTGACRHRPLPGKHNESITPSLPCLVPVAGWSDYPTSQGLSCSTAFCHMTRLITSSRQAQRHCDPAVPPACPRMQSAPCPAV